MYSMYCKHKSDLFRLIDKLCSLMAAGTPVSSELVPNGVLSKRGWGLLNADTKGVLALRKAVLS